MRASRIGSSASCSAWATPPPHRSKRPSTCEDGPDQQAFWKGSAGGTPGGIAAGRLLSDLLSSSRVPCRGASKPRDAASLRFLAVFLGVPKRRPAIRVEHMPDSELHESSGGQALREVHPCLGGQAAERQGRASRRGVETTSGRVPRRSSASETGFFGAKTGGRVLGNPYCGYQSETEPEAPGSSATSEAEGR